MFGGPISTQSADTLNIYRSNVKLFSSYVGCDIGTVGARKRDTLRNKVKQKQFFRTLSYSF